MLVLSKIFKRRAIISYLLMVNLGLAWGLAQSATIPKWFSPIGNNNSIKVLEGMYHSSPKKVVYGYLPYWILGNAKYLKYDKLTDIAYFGIHVGKDGNFVRLNDDGSKEEGFANWHESKVLQDVIHKSKLYNVRFALTLIGQDDYNTETFLNCEACWYTLLQNTILELKSKGLRDVNIDFESASEVDPYLREKFSDFVKFMNTSLDQEFGDSKVVVATFADSFFRDRITNPAQLANYSDALFIMAYDFHQPSSEKAGPVAPLYGSPNKFEFDVAETIKQYKQNVSKNKIILGVPYYGYNFVVEEPAPDSERIPGNDTIGFTLTQYYAMIKDSDAISLSNTKWDDTSKTPYLIYVSPDTGSTRVLHFENDDSLRLKYEFAKSEDLLGVGIWALGYDGDYPEFWDLLDNIFKK